MCWVMEGNERGDYAASKVEVVATHMEHGTHVCDDGHIPRVHGLVEGFGALATGQRSAVLSA